VTVLPTGASGCSDWQKYSRRYKWPVRLIYTYNGAIIFWHVHRFLVKMRSPCSVPEERRGIVIYNHRNAELELGFHNIIIYINVPANKLDRETDLITPRWLYFSSPHTYNTKMYTYLRASLRNNVHFSFLFFSFSPYRI